MKHHLKVGPDSFENHHGMPIPFKPKLKIEVPDRIQQSDNHALGRHGYQQKVFKDHTHQKRRYKRHNQTGSIFFAQ
jgi:hypothetical protein